MALIECPDCHAMISDVAPACPKCGRPITTALVQPLHKAGWSKKAKIAVGVLALLILVRVLGEKKPSEDISTVQTDSRLDSGADSHQTFGNAHTEPRNLAVLITLERLPGNKIEASTNLPDGTKLMASLQPPLATCSPNCGYVWQDHLTVVGGHFTMGPFRSDLSIGDYTLEITSSIAALQPESVRAVIGTNGEYLKGQFTKPELVPGVGPTVYLKASVEIVASNTQPSIPVASVPALMN